MLERHKSEVCYLAVSRSSVEKQESDFMIIIEGVATLQKTRFKTVLSGVLNSPKVHCLSASEERADIGARCSIKHLGLIRTAVIWTKRSIGYFGLEADLRCINFCNAKKS